MLKAIATCAVLVLTLVGPAGADDIPQAVKDACQADYEKHCSAHDPGSEAVRVCMAGIFEQLSDPCVTAIIDSPLADQEGAADAKDVAHVQDAAQEEAAAGSEKSATPQAAAQRPPVKALVKPLAAKRTARPARIASAAQPQHRPRLRHATAKPVPRPKVHYAASASKKRLAGAGRPKRLASSKAHQRTAAAKLKQRHPERRVAQARGSRRSVAGYIKRGTNIANYYVAKYTRFAIARASR